MPLDSDAWSADVLERVYQPWNIEVKQYLDGGYFARVVELPGCMTEADSATEVLEALEEARALWIEAALGRGDRIPEPMAASEYSGKIFIRTSADLHRAVAEAAAKEGVSMSQWASEVLARAAATRGAWEGPAVEVVRQTAEEYLLPYAATLAELQQVAKDLLGESRDRPSEVPASAEESDDGAQKAS